MTKTKLLYLLYICFLSNFCFAQNQNDFRDEYILKLAVDSEQFYQQEVNKSNYFVTEGVLQIYPGENLFIETEIEQNAFISMKVVKENLNPAKTIEIGFIQTVKEREHSQMILSVKNPFDFELNYDAMMYVFGNDKWINTSIIPIKPKLLGYEMWNDLIITLVLSDWRIE